MYPHFRGHLRSIPQCGRSNISPFVKSSLWEARLSPNEFLNFRTFSPFYVNPLNNGSPILRFPRSAPV